MRTEAACNVREEITRPGRASRAGLRTLALLGALLPLGLAAAPAHAQLAERLYQVEVVIFSQPEGTSVEQPPMRRPELPDLMPPAGDDLSMLEPHGDGRWLEPELDAPLLPENYRTAVLPRQLDAVARRLNSGGFQLLWHQAWVQPPAGNGPELAMLAALGQGTANPGLSGSISLTAGRFLHLGMDIELNSDFGLEAELHQRRRIRPRAEQYYDHPRIGIVAVVTPVEIADVPDQSTP